MNNKWHTLGLTERFSEVHHSSFSEFASMPLTLSEFLSDCKGNSVKSENTQTIKRALEVARYVERGIEPNYAIVAAWANHPLVNDSH